MSDKTQRAAQDFRAAEGRLQGAFNGVMNLGRLDPSVLTDMLAGLQRQAQGLATLADAVSELDEKVNALKRKMGVP